MTAPALVCPDCRAPLGRRLACARCGYRGVRLDGVPLLLPGGARARYRDSEWFVARLGSRWRRLLAARGARGFERLVRRSLADDRRADALPRAIRAAPLVTPGERARAAAYVERLRASPRRNRPPAIDDTSASGEIDPIAWLTAHVQADRRRRARVLDIGAGGGFLLDRLVRDTRADVTAVDLDFLCLRTADWRVGGRRGRARVIGADARALPFPDASFEIVTSNFGLSHVLRYRDALAELRRVLKPGGRLVAVETDYRWLVPGLPASRSRALARALGLHGGREGFVAALRRAGFQVARDAPRGRDGRFFIDAIRR